MSIHMGFLVDGKIVEFEPSPEMEVALGEILRTSMGMYDVVLNGSVIKDQDDTTTTMEMVGEVDISPLMQACKEFAKALASQIERSTGTKVNLFKGGFRGQIIKGGRKNDLN